LKSTNSRRGSVVTLVEFQGRRETREPVEMMARFRHGISTVTVMLKDITPHGARVEGVGPLETDDAVFLMLPGLAPKLAFVAWSNGQSAGLEFAEALDQLVFARLVADFGRRFEAVTRAA
jgi:hypothetical protein